MNLNHIYQTTSDLKAKAARVKMRDSEWRFLLAFDGTKTAQQIATDCNMDGAAATQLLLKLRENGLLVEAEMSLDEFLSRNAVPTILLPSTASATTPTSQPVPFAAAPVACAPLPVPITFAIRRNEGVDAAEQAGKATARPINRTLSVSASARGNGAAKDSTAISRDELAVEFGAKRGAFKLKPVIDFIIQRAGGGTVGQLAVYRVFLKIPPQLLHEAKVSSLNLVTDDVEIDHAPLREAVLNSVTETLGVSFPA